MKLWDVELHGGIGFDIICTLLSALADLDIPRKDSSFSELNYERTFFLTTRTLQLRMILVKKRLIVTENAC